MVHVWVRHLCLVAAFFLAGCERAPNQPAASPPKTVITFSHYFTDSLNGGIDDMARTFNSQNTRYELKVVSLDHEAFKTSIQDTLKAKGVVPIALGAKDQWPAQFWFDILLLRTAPYAELGLAAFPEFLAFPKTYPQLLQKLSTDAAIRFQSLNAGP